LKPSFSRPMAPSTGRFRVSGLGFRVQGFGFVVEGATHWQVCGILLGFRVQGFGFMACVFRATQRASKGFLE
jgi:hypothetical protein